MDLLWLLAGAGLVAAEFVTGTLVLAMLGAGALCAAVAAALGAGLPLQLGVFALVSTATLVGVRPPLRRRLDPPGSTARTDPRELDGARATVVVAIDDDHGQVRLNGELWRARPAAPGSAIAVGEVVLVASIDGATVLVHPAESWRQPPYA